MSCLNLLVDSVDTVVVKFVARDDEHGQDEQYGRDDRHKPEYALLGKRSLRGCQSVEIDKSQNQTGDNASQCHAGFIEYACQCIYDS